MLPQKLQLLKFENFELSVSSSVTDPELKNRNSSRTLVKSSSGGYFTLNSIFRPEKGALGGLIECSDIDIHVPDILLELEDFSVKSLLLLAAVLFPSSSSSSKMNSENEDKNLTKKEKSQWEKDFNIDLDTIPKATLRTLLWLEKQSHTEADRLAGDNNEDALDYDRLTEIMKNYLLAKKSFQENTENNLRNPEEHSWEPAREVAGTFCESDSGEDFPNDPDSDSDNSEGDKGGSDADSFDFQDAVEGRSLASIRKVKMGHNSTSSAGGSLITDSERRMTDRGTEKSESRMKRSRD